MSKLKTHIIRRGTIKLKTKTMKRGSGTCLHQTLQYTSVYQTQALLLTNKRSETTGAKL